jgi:NAD(P)-dependent dehydrogenase (short-subunit alcohol dehydrogenase family)
VELPFRAVEGSDVKRIEGRVAVVTGAASGIGRAISNLLAAKGAKVVMTDRDQDALEAAAQPLRQRGAEVAACQLDVTDYPSVERVADLAVQRFGGLHIAVNNAGIVNRGLAWELSDEEWNRVLQINLGGVVNGVRAFVPRILATGDEGHVVNTASMAAVAPQPRLGPYSVAKHGVLGLSDVLAADLAEVGAPVGVSVVMPGRIRTGMNPVGSIDPEVVAANVVDAIEKDRRYVFTDHHSTKEVKARLEAILAARDDVLPG